MMKANNASTQAKVCAPSGSDDGSAVEGKVLVSTQGDDRTNPEHTQTGRRGSRATEMSGVTMSRKADYGQRVSIDIAHWEILLNEVGLNAKLRMLLIIVD